MLDLNIDRLQLEINGAAGHEHRVRDIANRAAQLLAQQIDVLYGNGRGYPSRAVEAVAARPIRLNLNRTSDEQAARSIADAWMEALALRLMA
jgi:hypothetical protein